MPAVKTAISVDRELFEAMEELASRRKVSRSRLFAEAAQELVRKDRNQRLLEQINATCGEGPDEEEKAFMRRATALAAERLRREEEAAGAPPW
ncbi:MAG TPA: CopG family transcriptional regulator [Armatimonadota bacterium]